MSIKKFKEKYGPFALVAGGSYGLGAAYAEALASRGLNLVLIARGKERLTETADRLREQYSVTVHAIAADLADFENVKKQLSALDVSIGLLVYNAAFAIIELFENATEEDLAMASYVNVRAPLLLTKLLSPKMIQNKRGGIVLMSSLAGAQGTPKIATYVSTKAFNAILAEGLWKELKPHGVDVLGCVAGAILTPGYQQAEKGKPAPGTLSPKEVAEQTLKALGKGPIVVPGRFNRVIRFILIRFLTRKAAINLITNMTGGLS